MKGNLSYFHSELPHLLTSTFLWVHGHKKLFVCFPYCAEREESITYSTSRFYIMSSSAVLIPQILSGVKLKHKGEMLK